MNHICHQCQSSALFIIADKQLCEDHYNQENDKLMNEAYRKIELDRDAMKVIK
jgi:hypothetical protein